MCHCVWLCWLCLIVWFTLTLNFWYLKSQKLDSRPILTLDALSKWHEPDITLFFFHFSTHRRGFGRRVRTLAVSCALGQWRWTRIWTHCWRQKLCRRGNKKLNIWTAIRSIYSLWLDNIFFNTVGRHELAVIWFFFSQHFMPKR